MPEPTSTNPTPSADDARQPSHARGNDGATDGLDGVESVESVDGVESVESVDEAGDVGIALTESQFRALVLEALDAVYRMAYHLARERDLAQDLVQETCLRAFAARQSFRLRDRGIRPWLFRILHNVFYTRLQKQRRGPSLSEDLSQQADQTPDEPPAWDLASLDWEQVDERLKAAIDGLDVRFREVLLLWAVEGLKYREIAQVLDIPLGTVMSRLHRARSTLSAQLGELAAEHGINAEAAGPSP